MNRNTIKVKIGSVIIGGNCPIAVQSMTKTDTSNIHATVNQIKQLETAGCELVRVAVPDMDSAKVLGKIKSQIKIPLIADIHFNYKLALEAINHGVDKIRINPGNIGSKEKVRQIVLSAKQAGIPIRIGINSGSLNLSLKEISVAEQMVHTAVDYIKMFEDWDFQNIVVSVKASDVLTTIEAYRLLSKEIKYPLHLGITESGPQGIGSVKSTLTLGILLYEGIGDTIRVSLTASPVEEVKVAYYILQSLNLRNYGIDLISCPTCARSKVDMMKIVQEFEQKIQQKQSQLINLSTRPLKVAIMGCEVNGPGEAKHADIGIAGGKNIGLLFKHGKVVKKVKPENWLGELIIEIKNCINKPEDKW
ncbi:MAG: flavodoxin-dependent (E)-4-hydroxy-3-methylbut-2-enyl-diphosphate synthase [Elusimicrobiota bacterium]|nr:flavodoxin-dependent (E)-4-hydroxy-3-methylbut-2-enyl-diphosphate synthase [Elusimicrobiota bacterium]